MNLHLKRTVNENFRKKGSEKNDPKIHLNLP